MGQWAQNHSILEHACPKILLFSILEHACPKMILFTAFWSMHVPKCWFLEFGSTQKMPCHQFQDICVYMYIYIRYIYIYICNDIDASMHICVYIHMYVCMYSSLTHCRGVPVCMRWSSFIGFWVWGCAGNLHNHIFSLFVMAVACGILTRSAAFLFLEFDATQNMPCHQFIYICIYVYIYVYIYICVYGS